MEVHEVIRDGDGRIGSLRMINVLLYISAPVLCYVLATFRDVDNGTTCDRFNCTLSVFETKAPCSTLIWLSKVQPS